MENVFNKNHKNARHGDLVFTRTDRKIKGKKVEGSLILAEGEFTGHSHKLTPGEGGYIVFAKPQPTYKEFEVVGAPAILTHEEHKTITLIPGTYKVEIQEEYDYFSEELRRVTD